jgi:hypothetical protein
LGEPGLQQRAWTGSRGQLTVEILLMDANKIGNGILEFLAARPALATPVQVRPNWVPI